MTALPGQQCTPLADATAKFNGHSGDPLKSAGLADDLLDILDYLIFVWPTTEDARAADDAATLKWESATNPRFESAVREHQIVVASPDNPEGEAWAKLVAQRCVDAKAFLVRTWAVPEFGSKFGTMREWCKTHDLGKLLALEHAGKFKSFVVFVGSSLGESPKFEGDPRKITAELLPVPGVDPGMIPGPLRRWLVDIANRGSFPLEYGAAAAIVAMSGLIGRRIAIRPKRHDDWLVVPNLWGAVVGPPGIQKTPAVEESLRPLSRLAAAARANHQEATKKYAESQIIALAQKEAAKNELKVAAKKKDVQQHKLEELARQIAREFDEPAPTPKRYIVNDTTVEKLGELLAENPNGLTLFRDELSGFLRTLDKQGHESDRGFYLETWNGSGAYTVDRIGRGTIVISSACIALFGTIQPGPLARYLRGAISGEEADGFVPRFQILVYPDLSYKFIHCDRYPDTEAKNEAYAVFEAIDRLDPIALGCEVDQDRGLAYIGFSGEAQDFFDEWRIELENRLRSGDLSAMMTSHLAKYRSLLPCLALQFHLIDSYACSRLDPVSIEATKAAAAWCDLLERHAQRIYQAAQDGDPDDAIKLSDRIKGSLPNPFTYRQVAQKGWAGLTAVDDVRRAVGILEDRGWVKVVEVRSDDPRGRGRPSEQVWIHPKVLGGSRGVTG
jgi:putative DNA primase/helicase